MAFLSISWTFLCVVLAVVDGDRGSQGAASKSQESLIVGGSAKLQRLHRKNVTRHLGIAAPSEEVLAEVSRGAYHKHRQVSALQVGPEEHEDNKVQKRTTPAHDRKIEARAYVALKRTDPASALDVIACVMVTVLILTSAWGFGTWASAGPSVDKNTADRNFVVMQFVASSCLQSASVTVVVPSSFDIVADMGYGPEQAGMLVGSSYVLTVFSALALQPWLRSWEQPRMRKLVIATHVVFALVSLVYAQGVDPSTWWIFQTGHARFYSCLVARTLSNCIGLGLYVLYMMSVKMAPKEDWTRISLLKSASSVTGNAAGPLLGSFLCFVFKPTNIRTEAALPIYVVAICSVFYTLALWKYLPDELVVAEASDQAGRLESDRANSKRPTLLDGRSLSPLAKSSILMTCIFFVMARSLVSSGLGPASTYILQSDFLWAPREIGVVICLSILAGLPVCLFAMVQEKHWSTDVMALRASCVVPMLASLLFSRSLFPALLGADSPWLIVSAAALICPSMYLGYGIVDGLAFKVCMPGTYFSLENYVLVCALFNGVCRGSGSVASSFMVSRYGRDMFSGLQFGFMAIVSLFIFLIPIAKDPEECVTATSDDKIIANDVARAPEICGLHHESTKEANCHDSASESTNASYPHCDSTEETPEVVPEVAPEVVPEVCFQN